MSRVEYWLMSLVVWAILVTLTFGFGAYVYARKARRRKGG